MEEWPACDVVEVTMFWKWPCCGSDHVLEVANLWKGCQLVMLWKGGQLAMLWKGGQLATKNTVCILYICREKKRAGSYYSQRELFSERGWDRRDTERGCVEKEGRGKVGGRNKGKRKRITPARGTARIL